MHLSYAAKKREDRRAARRKQGLPGAGPRRRRGRRYNPEEARRDLEQLQRRKDVENARKTDRGGSRGQRENDENGANGDARARASSARAPLADLIRPGHGAKDTRDELAEEIVRVSDKDLDALRPIRGVFGGKYAPRVRKEKSLYTLSSSSDSEGFEDDEEESTTASGSARDTSARGESEVAQDNKRASREQVVVLAAAEGDEDTTDVEARSKSGRWSSDRSSSGGSSSGGYSEVSAGDEVGNLDADDESNGAGDDDRLEFPAYQNVEENERANNQLLSEILERIESIALDDEEAEETESQTPGDVEDVDPESSAFHKDAFQDPVTTSTITAAVIPAAPAAALLPPPPTPDQHRYRQRKNSKAVKNKARDRQRMRAKRNTLGINRLRRSSILPTMRVSLSVEFSKADRGGAKLDRRSSIFGGTALAVDAQSAAVPSTPKRSGMGFRRNRRDSLLESLPGALTNKRVSAVLASRSRRSSIKSVAGVGRKSSMLRSTFERETGSRRYSKTNNNSRASTRFSISHRTLETTHEIDVLLSKEAAESATAAAEAEGEGEVKHPGRAGTSTITATVLPEEDEEEEDGDGSGLSSDEDDFDGDDNTLFGGLFDPTVTGVDLAAAAAAETRQVVMILKLVFEFLPPRDLKTSTLFVSPTWHRSSVSALSWYIGTTVASHTRSFSDDVDLARLSSAALYRMRVSFAETFPWGQFLCRGGYKSVYKVWCAPRQRLEAVSVMDVDLISHGHNEHIVRQEVHVGTLLSDLVTSGESVNFIETFGMFHSTMEEPLDLWGSEDRKEPLAWKKFEHAGYKSSQLAKLKKRREGFFHAAGAGHLQEDRENHGEDDDDDDGDDQSNAGSYCYIRMELCDGGDMEGFLRDEENAPGGIIPPQECAGALYQMIHALDLAQRRFALRHYDIKLLNFFLKKVEVEGSKHSVSGDTAVKDDEIVEIARYEEEPGPEGEGETADAIDLRSSVVVRAPASRAYIVKLADYGTADIDLASLGMPILADNFATLENTPPDFLLLGNGGATQSFAADAFALGLSALHMFTGSMPYEEILEEVECPVKLRRDLTKIWTKDPAYAAVGSIVDDETTLHDTLYRFFVLFGFPKQEMVGGLYNYNGNPVLRAVAKCFRFRKSTTEGRGKGWKTFCAHRQKYALFDSGGSSASNMAMVSGSVYIQRARERMREIDGMETLVRQMLHYDPTRRIMMEGALRSPVFDCLREYS